MKRLTKILVLSLTAFFLNGFMGEAVLAECSAHVKAADISSLPWNHFPESYLFDHHQPAESGISLQLHPDISVFGEDNSPKSALVKAEAQRRVKIRIRYSRIINQYSELTKLIYPFHFFF